MGADSARCRVNPMAKSKNKTPLQVEALTHTEARRRNIPTAEHESVIEQETERPRTVRYPRNTDLDPQLVWRGKDEQDWTDLVVSAPPLYIQEKIHPKALIDDLMRQSKASAAQKPGEQIDLFADFNGIPEGAEKTEFYQHEQNWSNRMILGDSLQVMASLAEREGLRGKVQCIYFDPPYGIRFNSNFQWSTTCRDVKDGNAAHITREPEQVKAFRDTWRDGIHSYLTYLRDRLTVARDLLTESGSIFVQIGDENVHLVRTLLHEVFGSENFVASISFKKTTSASSELLGGVCDYILWSAKSRPRTKYRPIFHEKSQGGRGAEQYNLAKGPDGIVFNVRSADGLKQLSPLTGLFRHSPLTSQRPPGSFPVTLEGRTYTPKTGYWKTGECGVERLKSADRIMAFGRTLEYVRFLEDFPAIPMNNLWEDTVTSGFGDPKLYVVQTTTKVIQRCLLMTSDPGDLVLDPTCGSGTTAVVAEQWGRRWITIDTSRVALALARVRVMGARLSFYLLADSQPGVRKEAEVSGRAVADRPTHGSLRQGFVNERIPHITLKSIANNTEIDVIWQEHQPKVQSALDRLNAALRGQAAPFRVTTGGREGKDVKFNAPDDATFTMPSGEVVSASALVEWEVPREAPADWPAAAHQPLADFWAARIARQKAIDASIAAKAEFEFLYDRPYEDKKIVRVAGPFTVESLSPHRTLAVGADDELIDPLAKRESGTPAGMSFVDMILANLKTAGVQQAHKQDRITFTSLVPWPGELISAEGRYRETETRQQTGTGETERVLARSSDIAAAGSPSGGGAPRGLKKAGQTAGDVSSLISSREVPRTQEKTDASALLDPHGAPASSTSDSDPSSSLSSRGAPPPRADHAASMSLDGAPTRAVSGVSSQQEHRAAIFIGPEFGTVGRADLVRAAREAGDAGFDVLIACAFNYEAHAAEFSKLGRIPVLKARMNADLHMAGDLKATSTANLFVIFGEPDIDIHHQSDGQIFVQVKGVDVFDPSTGEVRSDSASGIACWFIDTDYNEESFFVRQAYFLGQNDPYGALRTTLKAEIDADAWETLHSDTSRPFPKPTSGRIAVKVINHLGDEVMKVFRVE
jgi:adenine-specific DNA-methyltransferase